MPHFFCVCFHLLMFFLCLIVVLRNDPSPFHTPEKTPSSAHRACLPPWPSRVLGLMAPYEHFNTMPVSSFSNPSLSPSATDGSSKQNPISPRKLNAQFFTFKSALSISHHVMWRRRLLPFQDRVILAPPLYSRARRLQSSTTSIYT